MKIKQTLLAATLPFAIAAAATTAQSATITATLLDPTTSYSNSFNGYMYVYRWDGTEKYWEWYDSAYASGYGSANVAIDVGKGKYMFEFSANGTTEFDSYWNDWEYYDNTDDFDQKQEVKISDVEESIHLGEIDFEYNLPPAEITGISYGKNSSYLPSEGGVVIAKLNVVNTTGADYDAVIWGVHEHYNDDDNSTSVRNSVTKNPKPVTLSPGANTVKLNFAIPPELKDGDSYVNFYVGKSYYSPDVSDYYGYIYKGNDYLTRVSTSTREQPNKKRTPKTISIDGKVLSWKE